MAPGFLDLNDDCLLEICKYLTIPETFNVIGAFDARFDEIAYRRIALLKHLDYWLREDPKLNAAQLRIVGKNLKSLFISAGYSITTEDVLHILRPLCAGGADAFLQQLTLNYIHFNASYSNCLSAVASQLRRLNLSCCQLTDEELYPLLAQCSNLRELNVVGNYTLCGEFVRAVNAKAMRVLALEKHGQWTFNLDDFHERHPHIYIVAYAEGRSTQVEYGSKTGVVQN